ncbi:MAG: NAD(P) transhydrogenase subunit alpha, partial [Nitrososphaerota archaeon]|nr:NAD(P) transhydrogenase subunit alpha [Nitrososphaerota archaeon]
CQELLIKMKEALVSEAIRVVHRELEAGRIKLNANWVNTEAPDEELKRDLLLLNKLSAEAPEMLRVQSEYVGAAERAGAADADTVARIEAVKKLASSEATAFAMELIPRISRAQPMDALSSQANLAGYKAVILAADTVPKLFPLMMTAAGTISPAKVFILGAGVAGLQAIATAKRLGALVEAYDVRPVVKEQVMSLGAKFAEMPVEAKDAQDSGGYAKAMGEEFTRKQQEFLAQRAKGMDVVITTALIPNQRAPILITEDAVKGMRPGSVVVDLAAEAKGNCAITEPGKTVVKYGVTIHGPLNLPSTMAPEASRLYSKNITGLLQLMLKEGKLVVDTKDEVVKGSMVVNAGQVVHIPTLKVIDPAAAAAMAPPPPPPASPAPPQGAPKR